MTSLSPVPTGALLLVLLAACAHAGWNLLAKTASGGAVFVWLCAATATVVYLPVFVFALVVAPGRVDATALGFVVVSGLLHAVYFVLLQRGYREGDLSFVYPLARGTGPLLSTGFAVVIFAERPGTLGLVGAALIVGAVFSLALGSGGAAQGAAAGFALATGLTIAAYTLWDKQAVDAIDLSPIVYYWGSNVIVGLTLSAAVAGRREELADTWSRFRRQALGVGLLSPFAYVLVLFALTKAPVSYVAPARETSILIGAVLGATVLSEGDVRRRVAAALAVVIGVTALAVA